MNEIKSIWENHWLTNMGEKHRILQKKLQEYMQVENIERNLKAENYGSTKNQGNSNF